MRLMDEQYLPCPFYGARRMHAWLQKTKGYTDINQKRVNRLYYDVMGLRAILPGKHTSQPNKSHKVYPYLRRELNIKESNQVWATDITYLPMQKGFIYLIAFIDLYSRNVMHWSVSNTMDAEWCTQALQEAIQIHGTPHILNTDQGAQFTSELFSTTVLSNEIKLSMDVKGPATDNAFVERLWRSVKYEYLYLNPPKGGSTLYNGLKDYFCFYNNERLHQAIDYKTPNELYSNSTNQIAA